MHQKVVDNQIFYLILKLHWWFEWYNWFFRKKKKSSSEYEEYVQDQVKQKGFVLTEEEEKMVQDAIARRLAENKDSGVELDDSEVENAFEVEEVFS